MSGGDSEKVTAGKSSIQTFAWRPDGGAFAYVAEDDPSKTKAPEDYVPAFRVSNEHFLTREPSRPAHVWTVAADGKRCKADHEGRQCAVRRRARPALDTGRERGRHDHALGSGVRASQGVAHYGDRRRERNGARGCAAMRSTAAPRSRTTASASRSPSRATARSTSKAMPRARCRRRPRRAEHRRDQPQRALVRVAADDKLLFVATADGVRNVLWNTAFGGTPRRLDLDVDFAPT
jgi:hypothetical protein